MGAAEAGAPGVFDIGKARRLKHPRSKAMRRKQERQALRQALAAVIYMSPWPRFVCDVYLHGRTLGSFAEDRYGVVTFDEKGQRFGRRKRLRRVAIEAIVARALGHGG